MTQKILLAVFLSTLLVSAAAAGPTASRHAGNVTIELSLNKSAYEIGENLEIRLSVTNQGRDSASFQFPTGQVYDFVVLRSGRQVWQWSEGRFFTQAFTTLSLNAGEAKVFREQWNQRDAQDQQASPGEYEMAAVFPAQGGRLPSALAGPRVRFQIGRGAQVMAPDVASRVVSIGGRRAGEVLLNGRPVLRIRVAAGGISAVDRAAVVANRLRQLLDAGLMPEELTVSRVGSDAAVMWRNRLVVTADASHARLNRTTPHALALNWRQLLVRALSRS